MKEFTILDLQELNSSYSFLVKGIRSYIIKIVQTSEILENRLFPFINNDIKVFSYMNQNIIFNNEIFIHYSLKYYSIKNYIIKIQVFEDNICHFELLKVILFCFNTIKKTNYIVEIKDDSFMILDDKKIICLVPN